MVTKTIKQTQHMFKTLLIIGLGSFCGGIFRFLLTRFVQNHFLAAFPFGTMVVNIVGCFLIGIFYALFERGNLLNTDLRLFLTGGLCGGFTTFSTFMNENFVLLREQNYLYFMSYTVLSIVLGLTAVYVGHLIIKAL